MYEFSHFLGIVDDDSACCFMELFSILENMLILSHGSNVRRGNCNHFHVCTVDKRLSEQLKQESGIDYVLF